MTDKDRKARDERVRLRKIIAKQRQTINAMIGHRETMREALAESRRREESAPPGASVGVYAESLAPRRATGEAFLPAVGP